MTANTIKKALKAAGIDPRYISVKTRPALYDIMIHVTVKSLDIDLEAVERVVKSYESFDWDRHCNEILLGGNVYVLVTYDWELFAGANIMEADIIRAARVCGAPLSKAVEAAREAQTFEDLLKALCA